MTLMIIVDAVFISAGPHNPRIIPIQADHAILAQTRLVKRVISYITHPVQTFIQDIDTAMIGSDPDITVHILRHVTHHYRG